MMTIIRIYLNHDIERLNASMSVAMRVTVTRLATQPLTCITRV